MNYFEAIEHRCSQLEELGQKYLNQFEFLPNDVIIDRIFEAAKKIFEANNGDWDKVPDWVDSTMDGWMPYSGIPKNGSLYFALGFSVVSNDAHLRNLLEIAEGRETKQLDFAVLAEKEVVDKLVRNSLESKL